MLQITKTQPPSLFAIQTAAAYYQESVYGNVSAESSLPL